MKNCFLVFVFLLFRIPSFSQDTREIDNKIDYVFKLIQEITSLEKQLVSISKDSKEWKIKYNKLNEKYNELLQKYNNVEKEIGNWKNEIELKNEVLDSINKQSEKLKNEIQNLEQNVEKYKNKLRTAELEAIKNLDLFKIKLDEQKKQALRDREASLQKSNLLFFDGICPGHQINPELKSPEKVSFQLDYYPLLEEDYQPAYIDSEIILYNSQTRKIEDNWQIRLRKKIIRVGNSTSVRYNSNDTKYDIKKIKKASVYYLIKINGLEIKSKVFKIK